MKSRSFVPLFATNFLGVVNDNFMKTLASFLVIGWLADKSLQGVFMGVAAGALVLPFILFSPLADRLTYLFPKVRILRLAKAAELPIVAMAIVGFILQSPTTVVGAIVVMGLQSALYSPAKYALVRDIGGKGRISTGMGGMEAVTFAAVLTGTVAGSFVADLEPTRPWVKNVGLLTLSALGLAASFTIRADEERSRDLHAVNPLRYLKRAWRMTRHYEGLNAVILTLSVFWWAAAMLQMGLLVYGRQVLALDATHTGLVLALAAVGIVVGQVVAGFIDRRRFLLGWTPLTGALAGIMLLALYLLPLGPRAFSIVTALLAFDFGIFKLPFDTEIQKVAKGPRLNTMLAYFNQVSFLFMLAASGIYALVSWAFGPRAFLLVLALAMLVTPLWFCFNYRPVLCYVGKWVLSRRYAVTTTGCDVTELSHKTPVVVLPNHPAMVDPMLVGTQLWQTPLRPLCDELFLDRGGISAAALKTLGAIRVPDLRKHRTAAGAKAARGLTCVVADALRAGKNVIFYPSGHLWTAPREEIGTRQLAYNVCRELPPNARVVGIRTLGLWGSIWSRKDRDRSPSFAPTLAKSAGLWFCCLLTRRRRTVTMHCEDLTERVRQWATLSRLEFNGRLEAWYNQRGGNA